MQFESDNESADSASHGNLAEFKLEHFLLGKTMFESCFIMIYYLTSLEIPIKCQFCIKRIMNSPFTETK